MPDVGLGQTREPRLELLNTFSLYFLSCLDVAYRHWSALAPGKITLGDLKRCRMAHIFFDTFFNLEKYLDHEQRDPFAVQKVGLSHWFTV